MKAINYIRYFFYIGINWNLRLACFTLYHEIRGENFYEVNTTGIDNLQNLQLRGKFKNSAEEYQGASYLILEQLFAYLKHLGVSHSILDFGSGKGRVMAVAAHFGFRHITGVEFAKELCVEAEINLQMIRKKFPSARFDIFHENAVDHIIADDTVVFFFFNPFQEPVMKRVIAHILTSIKRSYRTVYIMYVNPQLKMLFLDQGFEEVFRVKKMEFVEASILVKK